jgi:hypothetical protein
VLALIILFISHPLYSQNHSASVGIRGSSSLSANRFGTVYSPSVFYSRGNTTVSLGLTIQKQRLNTSGVQFNYEYTLLDPQRAGNCYIEWLELYSFLSVAYHDKALLGRNACEEERYANRELKSDPSLLKFKAMDLYCGFGLRVVLTKNIRWFNGIGIGGYGVFNSPEELIYNNKGLGILLRTGISYKFIKPTKMKY